MVDVSPDTTITLNFKSNLLGEIDKITASNSQTITLPKTPKNRRIMGNAGAPSAFSSQRYNKMPARYVRDGVEVVKAAYAVLLSSGEGYEVAIYWGLMTNFSEWVDSGATIGDVVEDSLSMTWANNTSLSTSLQPLMVADYWNGIGSYGHMGDYGASVALHPFVQASYILQRIAAVYGLTFDYSQYVGNQLARMAVLCDTRNALATPVTSGVARLQYDYSGWNYLCAPNFSAAASTLYTIGSDTFAFAGADTPVGVSCIIPNLAGTLKLQVDYQYTISGEGSVRVVILKKNANGTTLVGEVGHTIFEGYILTTPNIIYSVEVEEGDKVAVCFLVEGGLNIGNDYTLTPTITFTPSSEGLIVYGGSLYAKNNLPDVTTVQFVKDLCAMLGLQAMADTTNPNIIHLVSLKELEQNKAEAVDWSDKLLDAGGGEPLSITYTLDGYAQRNLFAYTNDEEVTATTDGELLVASDNLEDEAEIVTLKWSASNEVENDDKMVASIPLYAIEEQDGAEEAVLQNVGPRMAYLKGVASGGSTTYLATASPLYWGNLLGDYYAPLQNLLTNAVVIEEQVRLSAYDLKTLDFSRPIYLRQYGKYYALKEVQTEKGEDVCKVTLVQLGGWVVNSTVELLYLVDANNDNLVDINDLDLVAKYNNEI